MDMELPPPQKGVSTLELGLASWRFCRSALPRDPHMGWLDSQELKHAGGSRHE